jgi:hypothetical protein
VRFSSCCNILVMLAITHVESKQLPLTYAVSGPRSLGHFAGWLTDDAELVAWRVVGLQHPSIETLPLPPSHYERITPATNSTHPFYIHLEAHTPQYHTYKPLPWCRRLACSARVRISMSA